MGLKKTYGKRNAEIMLSNVIMSLKNAEKFENTAMKRCQKMLKKCRKL